MVLGVLHNLWGAIWPGCSRKSMQCNYENKSAHLQRIRILRRLSQSVGRTTYRILPGNYLWSLPKRPCNCARSTRNNRRKFCSGCQNGRPTPEKARVAGFSDQNILNYTKKWVINKLLTTPKSAYWGVQSLNTLVQPILTAEIIQLNKKNWNCFICTC